MMNRSPITAYTNSRNLARRKTSSGSQLLLRVRRDCRVRLSLLPGADVLLETRLKSLPDDRVRRAACIEALLRFAASRMRTHNDACSLNARGDRVILRRVLRAPVMPDDIDAALQTFARSATEWKRMEDVS